MNSEEERRRQIARDNLRILEEQKLNVKKTLQAELDTMQIQKLQNVTFNQDIKLLQKKVQARLSPTCVSLENNITVGTKDGSVIKFDLNLNKLSQIVSFQGLPEKTTNQRQRYASPFQKGHSKPVYSVSQQQKYNLSMQKEYFNVRDADTTSSATVFGVNLTALSVQANIAAVADDKTIQIVQLADQVVLHSMIGHVDTVTQIQFLQNSTQFISCSTDSTLRLFDYDQQSQLIYTVDSPLECCACLSTDYFVGGGEQLYLISRKKRTPVFTYSFESDIYCRKLITAVGAVQGYNCLVVGLFNKLVIFKMNGEQLIVHKEIPLQNQFVNGIDCKIINNKFTVAVVLGGERKFDRLDKTDGKSELLVFEIGDVQKQGRFRM
ncbi:U3_small nucleolar RNA interacting protein [Hexamita inflata]|uniref:U3 small nucleolar RNA interacting protein n=1 Tax=Hexamita inflata TaxID=28002 RepID=A0AA86RC24_9EUKA|nr:U3 small nucleolar RNA interacting protein [Hexamita inflata]